MIISNLNHVDIISEESIVEGSSGFLALLQDNDYQAAVNLQSNFSSINQFGLAKYGSVVQVAGVSQNNTAINSFNA
jgi:hypothetical protein